MAVIFIIYVKAKIALGNIQQARTILFEVIAIGKRGQELKPTETKICGFKSWGEERIRAICLC